MIAGYLFTTGEEKKNFVLDKMLRRISIISMIYDSTKAKWMIL